MELSSAIESYRDPSGQVRFDFTYSSREFTTGVMTISPGGELPRHNRPKAIENLLQIAGSCVVRFFGDENVEEPAKEVTLEAGSFLRIPRGHFHVHANISSEDSLTLFKADGDIQEVMAVLVDEYSKVPLHG